MRALVTGGAGFIGRWVVKELLDNGWNVWVLDNLSNGREFNLAEFFDHPKFENFVKGDIVDYELVKDIFRHSFDYCFHLAAKINVQDSIDSPREIVESDVIGTFNILEECKKNKIPMTFMSSCMVYAPLNSNDGIDENHQIMASSPYSAVKIACEKLTESYFRTYGLPTIIIRPFNTYGPFQKTTGEGGVIATFAKRHLLGLPLEIYGDGTQTRDFLYVEDCSKFVLKSAMNESLKGKIINAGSGYEISINELAGLIEPDSSKVIHIPHIHPQSEIMRLKANSKLANDYLNWKPSVSLFDGIKITIEWIKNNDLY